MLDGEICPLSSDVRIIPQIERFVKYFLSKIEIFLCTGGFQTRPLPFCTKAPPSARGARAQRWAEWARLSRGGGKRFAADAAFCDSPPAPAAAPPACEIRRRGRRPRQPAPRLLTRSMQHRNGRRPRRPIFVDRCFPFYRTRSRHATWAGADTWVRPYGGYGMLSHSTDMGGYRNAGRQEWRPLRHNWGGFILLEPFRQRPL